MDGATLLREYLRKHDMKQAHFARVCGVSNALVSLWVNRKTTPGRTNALRVEAVTRAAVPAASWDMVEAA